MYIVLYNILCIIISLKGFIELNVTIIMSYILFYIILLCHPRITSLYRRLLSRIMADRYRNNIPVRISKKMCIEVEKQ